MQSLILRTLIPESAVGLLIASDCKRSAAKESCLQENMEPIAIIKAIMTDAGMRKDRLGQLNRNDFEISVIGHPFVIPRLRPGNT
jgi:hypothetical protein